MGVTYKLKDEVVRFIISQRQNNPFFSCRQLAESASQKFDLHLSKSSVHDVLKESGIITPRGRKPKNKFEIPEEKKKQIQVSLSQIKLLPAPVEVEQTPLLIPNTPSTIPNTPSVILSESTKQCHPTVVPTPVTVIPAKAGIHNKNDISMLGSHKEDAEVPPEYEGAGKIFLKAALWDLGIFSEENVKEMDWEYYLKYTKGIKIDLENDKSVFIDLPLPLERCIRETADGLINNVRPFIVHKVSDEEQFKACMEAQAGFKIEKVSIVEQNNHVLLEFSNIMNIKRTYSFKKILIVESCEIDALKRSKQLFFSQNSDSNDIMENIENLKGFDTINKGESTVTLLMDDSYNGKAILQEAAEKLNGMYLRDDQNRLVTVKIQVAMTS